MTSIVPTSSTTDGHRSRRHRSGRRPRRRPPRRPLCRRDPPVRLGHRPRRPGSLHPDRRDRRAPGAERRRQDDGHRPHARPARPTDRRGRPSLGQPPRSAVAAGRIGSMLQDSGLPSNVRVGELVDFARRLYPQPLGRGTILERAGLTDLTGRRSDRLSGGEAPAPPVRDRHRGRSRTSCSSTSRRSRWTSRRGGPSGPTCAGRRPRAGRSCSRPITSRRPTRSPTGSIVLDRGRVVADGTGRSLRDRVGGGRSSS